MSATISRLREYATIGALRSGLENVSIVGLCRRKKHHDNVNAVNQGAILPSSLGSVSYSEDSVQNIKMFS